MIKTFSPKASQVTRDWHVLDASGQILGRLATRAATYLRGKHKPTFTPHMDMGDHVVIVNAELVRVTGNKLSQKMYYRHSGYPGGLKSRTLEQQLARFPNRVVEAAVRGMLPRNALGRAMLRKLHVYAGPTHPHRGQVEPGPSQQPTPEIPANATTTSEAAPANSQPDEVPAATSETPAETAEATPRRPARRESRPRSAGSDKEQKT